MGGRRRGREDNASSETLEHVADYAAVHEEIVDLDESGQYDEAVALATTTDADGPTAALDAFDAASQELIVDGRHGDDRRPAQRQHRDPGARRSSPCCSGSAAAGMAAWGIGQRRKEYA